MNAEQQSAPGLAFHFDPEARAVIATVTPNAEAQSIDEAWLRKQLADLGYGELCYLPAAGLVLIAQYNLGATVVVRLAECVDASVRATIAPDGLTAHLYTEPAQGGSPVTRMQILAALKERGVVDGVLHDVIAEAVVQAAAESVAGLVVARGREPIAGSDGILESLVPEVRSRAPKVSESGHIDYRDLGEILEVHPGDRLMRRHAPTEGINGLTVLGEPIPAQPGKEIMFAASQPGTVFASDDPNLLLSAIAGQPVIIRGGMMVEPVFTVDAVGAASGNINFDGSVVIRGDVTSGMTVKATGDIEIGGVVELATLEAGGSIVIKGGVMGGLGRKGGGEQHTIRCGACFNAAYVQQANIEAGDSIFIDDMVMQCELAAINHIRVGNKRRGHIIGGFTQATLSITAKVIGSPNRVHTRFDIGVNPLMQKQMLEMAKVRDGKETQLLEISKLLDFANQNAGKIRPEMIEKARVTAAAVAADIAALREEQDLLMTKIELSQQARVVAERAIHEGVEVLMGKQRYHVVGDHGPCAIGLGEAGLCRLAL